jgi:twitching motility protein PilT
MNTLDATKTVRRFVTSFSPAEEASVRTRFAKSFRYIISQRLVPRVDGSARIPVLEILKANVHTRTCIENGEREAHTLLENMKSSAAEGMQYFDGELERLVRGGILDLDTALSYATSPTSLRTALGQGE